MRTSLATLVVSMLLTLGMLPNTSHALTNVRYSSSTGCYEILGPPNGTTLAAAIAELTWDACLLIPRTIAGSASGNWTIASNLTVPARIQLQIEKGPKFEVANGVTLTLSACPEAGLYQIYVADGVTTGLVRPSCMTYVPEHWGAVAGDATSDALAVDQAVDAASVTGGIVQFRPGVYLIDTQTITVGSQVTLIGATNRATILRAGETLLTQVLNYDANGLGNEGGARDLTIDCNGYDETGDPEDGPITHGAQWAIRLDTWDRPIFQRLDITNCGYGGVWVDSQDTQSNTDYVILEDVSVRRQNSFPHPRKSPHYIYCPDTQTWDEKGGHCDNLYITRGQHGNIGNRTASPLGIACTFVGVNPTRWEIRGFSFGVPSNATAEQDCIAQITAGQNRFTTKNIGRLLFDYVKGEHEVTKSFLIDNDYDNLTVCAPDPPVTLATGTTCSGVNPSNPALVRKIYFGNASGNAEIFGDDDGKEFWGIEIRNHAAPIANVDNHIVDIDVSGNHTDQNSDPDNMVANVHIVNPFTRCGPLSPTLIDIASAQVYWTKIEVPGAGAVLDNCLSDSGTGTIINNMRTQALGVGFEPANTDGEAGQMLRNPDDNRLWIWPNAAGGGFKAGSPWLVDTLCEWVTFTAQSVALGRVPINSHLLAATLQVAGSAEFNSDGTDLMTIGTAGNPDAFLTATDVSTAGIKAGPGTAITITNPGDSPGDADVLRDDLVANTLPSILTAIKTQAGLLGDALSNFGRQASNVDVVAAYANGGTEPTQGKALACVYFHTIPPIP